MKPTLADSIKTLGRRPPGKYKLAEMKEIWGEIAVLERQLELPHSFPTLNARTALSRLADLQARHKAQFHQQPAGTNPREPFDAASELARIEEHRSGKPQNKAGASPAIAITQLGVFVLPAPTVVATVSADVRPVAEYLALSPEGRRQFAADGLKLTYADFSKLNSAQKSAFGIAGGKIHEEHRPAGPFRCTAAASFGK